NLHVGPTVSGFFDDLWNSDFADWGFYNFLAPRTTMPAVNIMDEDDHFLVEMAAPGMKKEDFHIELDNDMLTISCEKETKHDVDENGGRYRRREFSYRSFQRSFHLPKTVVDEGKIKAKYENGLLRIEI